MRTMLLTALLLGSVALAQSPFSTFECAIYGTSVEIDRQSSVDVWTAPSKSEQKEGLVVQGKEGRIPVQSPSVLSPSGPSHNLKKSEEMQLRPGSYTRLEGYNSARFLLAPGVYRIDSIELHNSASIDLDGPVVLYLGKSLTLRNSGGLNERGRPADLEVYQAEPHRPVEVQVLNSARAHMAFCGPTAKIFIKNSGQVYGSLLAQQVVLSQQGAVHYDPGLKSVKIRK